MKQEKLENKVRELFERQGFQIKEYEYNLKAIKDDQELTLEVFSSENYGVEDISSRVSEGVKVFVDGGLEEIKNQVENQVSVIRDGGDEEEYDLPSYELIGEIAVINELTVGEEEAVEGILNHHPSVKTILLKEEPLQGEFRVGEYEKLYGEDTETVHKEFGCRFKVDPTKVYYSERFSTERKRVVDQIEDGEKVLVMFAGVGPFAIMAAKLSNPEKVVAVEKNPVAADYLKENIEVNDVGEVVEGYEGDVREKVPEMDDEFDRVIMPLPEQGYEFLDLAVGAISGGVVHLYAFVDESDFSQFEEDISSFLSSRGVSCDINEKIRCGVRSPSENRYCFDLVLY